MGAGVALFDYDNADGDGRTYAGMGVDFADYNNDGLPDVVITNLANQMYALYRNNGDGSFTYASYESDLGRTVVIRWPSGIVQTLNDVAADQVLQVDEPPSPTAVTTAK